MKRDANARLKSAMLALCSAFGREVDEPFLLAYEMGLEDLTVDQISIAIATAIRTLKFMPTVAALRDLAGVLSPEARAIIAWQAFSKAATTVGFYGSVDFDDQVINATVRNLGGWEYLTTIEDVREFESFIRQRFEKVYVALYHAGISAEQAAPLVGYSEAQNRMQGYDGNEFNGVAINQVHRIATGLPKPAVRITGPSPCVPRVGMAKLKTVNDEGS